MPITDILQLGFVNACKEIWAGLRPASLDTDNNESLMSVQDGPGPGQLLVGWSLSPQFLNPPWSLRLRQPERLTAEDKTQPCRYPLCSTRASIALGNTVILVLSVSPHPGIFWTLTQCKLRLQEVEEEDPLVFYKWLDGRQRLKLMSPSYLPPRETIA